MDLSQDLIARICKLLPDIRDKLTFLSLRRHYKLVCDYGIITELDGRRLTDQILRQPKFRNLRILKIRDNHQITSVSHLTKLEELDISGYDCEVDQAGIAGCLRLEKLNVRNNPRITSVNHLPELEDLDASGYYCRVDQAGIAGCLRLKKLNIDDNRRITTVNHLTELEELIAAGRYCGVDQAGIAGCLRLKKLKAHYNSKITSVNHLPELEDLYAVPGSGFSQEGIQCPTLRKLSVHNNRRIFTLSDIRPSG